MSQSTRYNPDFIHHQDSRVIPFMREVVFGMEDGMVSSLGAITGIATATGDHFVVILSGMVVIAVESISMGVGSYLSNKSEVDVTQRKIHEEKIELKEDPEAERDELRDIYIRDGWPEQLAETMATTASQDHDLFLNEMKAHELYIIDDEKDNSMKKGIVMFFSYVLGGLIPLIPYLILPLASAIVISIGITLIGLFALGSYTTRYTKRSWWKAGLEMLGLASAAAVVGYAVGQAVDTWFLSR